MLVTLKCRYSFFGNLNRRLDYCPGLVGPANRCIGNDLALQGSTEHLELMLLV